MFTRLRTKLTVLYAGLFGLALLLIASAVYLAIASNAERQVRGELQASGTVFDRVWALRSQQLRDNADLISKDFGFRAAVATRDAATVRSALDNLKGRVGLETAFLVDMDGNVTGLDAARLDAGVEALWSALDAQDGASGVLMIGGQPYQAISAPVMAPTLTGWVVFATRLDAAQMRSLEQLSAIPLTARVLIRKPDSHWTSGRDTARVDAFVAGRSNAPGELDLSSGAALALAKPLPSLGAASPAVLLLQYPLATAMAPYRPLLITIGVTGLLGILLLIAGSWVLARSLTRPISALDKAVRRLQRGEEADVAIETQDEIGRLAGSFNSMAAEIRERERHITHLALHDSETGLPNRVSLDRGLETLCQSSRRTVFVAALGLDRFQIVRGAIGYELAARLIAEVGGRMMRQHPDRPIGRLSSGILALAFEASSLEDARAFAAALLGDLEQPVTLDGSTVDVSLTIGLAPHADQGAPAIDRASIAVDQARAGHQKIGLFDAQAYGDPASNLSLTSEMMSGLKDGQLFLHHQPKFDLRSRRIGGVEVLARWKHPERGMIRPDLFIGMAEETGHIRPLTEWALTQAIADQARLREAGHALTVSVNLSGRLMSDPDLAQAAIDQIRAAQADICFEITETAVMDNPAVALGIIDAFAANGIGVSIDDYGSGVSSLAYLKQIKANELKIDKAFVSTMADSRRDALLVKSTIDLAHSLGLKVTAEGIETPEVLAMLTGMGCDLAQGYLIAKPMPLAELIGFLDSETAPVARPRRKRA
ncbi:EAL domain-containing protein (putative c-di-GMP-specific phosphodiesterase class I)/GGDEF domain-containing protein [Caulobacter ginsengisoli]|uniref:EAL domain-containing protein (Putative c-di-GMP-specific phosphodiesterase class I)/GGDEF domain-containing protein n=1 Tax=Caulobacter ginsengisoli TaxID=400775 RepID=A0ABU0ISD0_9CAUL|nr:EAL domain-containing protein [Caulobacter ginsengisoli]MDQ0463862.1 EAL domain-containing protein (putative c-di-GMP-specific phosphodiesterase class I)/GGDEF domain-containing protein [Caulobacter ginsengisoli]